MNNDLYGDLEPKVKSNNTVANDDILIVLDFSKETFGEMVEKVRNIIESTPDHVDVNLFILSGYNPHPDAGLFLDYLKKLPRTFRLFFRGIIHIEFMKIFSNPNLHINENSKFKFDPKRTHEFQSNLMAFPNVFRQYFQRFIDEYHKFKGDVYLDVTELKTLGFNFETY